MNKKMAYNMFKVGSGSGKAFVLLVVAITVSLGFGFLVGQQVLRTMANDPQVEISDGVSEALNLGQDPKAFGSLNPTDMTKSLSPFVIVLDQEGKVVSGTALLDGSTPAPPKSVLDAAKLKGQNRITWEPRKGVKVAAIIKPYSFSKDEVSSSGFILVGKSLSEVESRTISLLKFTGIAWAVGLLVAWLAVTAVYGSKEEHSHSHEEHPHEHHHH